MSLLSGSHRPFWAKDFPLGEVAPKDQYGLVRRGGHIIAKPLDGDVPRNGRCLMEHYCAEYAEHKLMKSTRKAGEAVPDWLRAG